MRILMVLRAPTGGLWRHVVDLADDLAQRGHDIGIVLDANFTNRQTTDGLDRLQPLASMGIHRLPISRNPGFGDLAAALAVRRIVREVNAEVVHGHGAKGGFYARVSAVGGQRISAYTPHGGVLNYPQDFLGRLYRRVEAAMLGVTDIVFFESAYAQRAYFEQIGTPKRWEVVHNGLMPADFEPVPPAAELHDFAFIGELRPAKGLSYLLDAMKGLKRPDGSPATLLVAGDGPDSDAALAQVKSLGIADHVTFAGVQPAADVFARGRCIVIPSLAESLPYVILEAAGVGRPIISTGVGGIKEIFGPTADQLLPPRDPSALHAAMQAFLDDPAGGQREADERLAFVKAHFLVGSMTDAVEALYRERLQARRSA